MAASIKEMATILADKHWKTFNDYHKNCVSRTLGRLAGTRPGEHISDLDKIEVINLFLKYEVYEKRD